jgi:BCD family chlorophyll transporter-like MFS transporter
MLNWLHIVRLGLVQMALGAIVVLTTSTLNRLMVVELALPAVLSGALVALHYGVQITRPGWGYRSDVAGNRTMWIIGGMAILAMGAVMAAVGVVLLGQTFLLGLLVSIVAYVMIGLGVGASGTSLLALLATATPPDRRAAAATITWLMMILGIALTAGVVGQLLDPYTPMRLVRITATLALGVVFLTIFAVGRIEAGLPRTPPSPAAPLLAGLAEIWAEPRARAFTIFVALSMTAYFMQELILEPYAGLVFAYSPGQSTTLSGAQNGGVFVGMVLVGLMSTGLGIGSLRSWVVAGCIGSAAALAIIAGIGTMGSDGPLMAATVMLGAFNGMFAVAAIGSMMALAGEGRTAREGTRMGLWGAAQAVAAGFGGLTGAALVDALRIGLPDVSAFGTVFLLEAALFLVAALLATRLIARPMPTDLVPGE